MDVLGRRHPAGGSWASFTIGATLLLSGAVGAQSLTAPVLKAGFLYNFAKFAQWPAEVLAQGAPLSLCIVGDGALAEALAQAVKGQGIDGHRLTVTVITGDGPIRDCHLLYVSGLDRKQAVRLLDTMKNSAAFTVSDGDHFAEMGGVAQLILESSRLRIVVNLDAVHRARLTISSKLLSLAQIVKDGPDVLP